ncbi:hypothetical protein Pmani_026804 [Petrolisthes manimaculis]|uniref:Uncharacterized protein n=1 Tax=Petrolisthes manimaculis TaxID=1843537 RepID=A0AAE1P5D8_9EUCA|nr:hypothetical protein Pmani_026804 [Petrolisthes manimaculis]
MGRRERGHGEGRGSWEEGKGVIGRRERGHGEGRGVWEEGEGVMVRMGWGHGENGRGEGEIFGEEEEKEEVLGMEVKEEDEE